MSASKQPRRASGCKLCLGKCPTPQACELAEDNRFDDAVAYVRDVLAGIGFVSMIIFICFIWGKNS